MLGVISGQSSAIYCKAINEKSYRDFINVDSKKRIYVLCMTHMFKVKRPSYEVALRLSYLFIKMIQIPLYYTRVIHATQAVQLALLCDKT